MQRTRQEQRTPAEIERDAAHLAYIVRQGLERHQYYISVQPSAKTVKLSLEYFLDAPGPEKAARTKPVAKRPTAKKPAARKSAR